MDKILESRFCSLNVPPFHFRAEIDPPVRVGEVSPVQPPELSVFGALRLTVLDREKIPRTSNTLQRQTVRIPIVRSHREKARRALDRPAHGRYISASSNSMRTQAHLITEGLCELDAKMHLNFLHFGNALLEWDCASLPYEHGEHLKRDLLNVMLGQGIANSDAVALIKAYGRARSQKLDIHRFFSDVQKSLLWRDKFRALDCRGFSYRIEDRITFSSRLAKRITLRMALMSGDTLFYPPRVRQYLRRVKNNHHFTGGYPSIAFALGTKTKHAWFVFALQSDLAFASPSCVRDHFRGWRKVFFDRIINLARHHTSALYLCRAADAVRACHPRFSTPSSVPASWEVIYDGTAKFFRMELMCLGRPVNIQLYPRLRPVFARQFYGLTLDSPSGTI
jgi:hypothetical protein